MLLRQIFEPHLAQYSYLIGCQRTGEAILVDPLRDIDRYLELAKAEGLQIVAAAETHIHADFLSGVRELGERLGAELYLSAEGGTEWQSEWARQGPYRAHFLKDGDTFQIGKIELQALHTPGHTPEHLSYLIVDRGAGADEAMGMLSGDFVFVGDLGRPDLLESAAGEAGAMEPSARTLYRSVQRFLDLPDYLQLWPGHGAGSACGKALGAVPATTVGYERRFNLAVRQAQDDEERFVSTILEGQPEPPLYFGRMKKLNREGPPLLESLPSPRRMSADKLAGLAEGPNLLVLDTRRERREFMAGHLNGSLYAPVDQSFPTVVGSYAEAGQSLYLVVEEGQLEGVIRDLVRIGYDRVAGYTTPDELREYGRSGGEIRTTPVIDLTAAVSLAATGAASLVDVRSRGEFDAGHLAGARNIAHTRLRERLGEIRDGEVAVYCQTGNRAAPAAALLERAGYSVHFIDDDLARGPELETAH